MEEETIECEIERGLPVEEGEELMFAGRTGEADYKSLAARRKRTDGMLKRLDYRECIPCDRCMHCIELRGFKKSGTEIVIGYICLMADSDIDADHTCNMARRSKKLYKRVVYFLKDAPIGFKEGLTEKQLMGCGQAHPEEKLQSGLSERLAATMPIEGYKGGSEYYKRVDGDKEAEGTSKIPGRLVN